MKTNKQQYFTPTTEVIEIEVQSTIMTTSQMQDVEINDTPSLGNDFWGN